MVMVHSEVMLRDLLWGADPVEFCRAHAGKVERPTDDLSLVPEFAPEPWQVEFLAGGIKFSLMLCYRQAGKTTVVAVKAAHKAIYKPGSLTLIVSRSERQSKILFKKVRRVLTGLVDPRRLPEDNKTSVELENGSAIAALPGTEETIRGHSAPSLIIVDEAARVDNELYLALRPMLQQQPGRMVPEIVGLTTPWGKRGWFYDAWKLPEDHAKGNRLEEPDPWHRYIWTAEDAVRIGRLSQEWLDQERASLPDYFFRQEYLCEFVETEETLIGEEFIEAAVHADKEVWSL